jgi:glycine dehydrogenase subunit 2
MDETTLAPAAGAHGEWTGMLMIRAYHEAQGRVRKKVLVPTAAHGTNPATAAGCGYEIAAVPEKPDGELDLAALDKVLDEDVAAIMLTNPNTLGVFERQIEEIAARMHQVGALLYYDGANLNAVLGKVRPGDMGFDVVHVNLHKTFSTPHGCGGPGAGPVGVKEKLRPFLPGPYVKKTAAGFVWADDRPHSIGRVGSFYGNVGVLIRAFAYILRHGRAGLPRIAEDAVLNAAYLRARLSRTYKSAVASPTLHEFVISPSDAVAAQGVRALHVAKRLIDLGCHPPTVYFPLVVKEALMIEPTETENLATLDAFCAAMEQIAREAVETPDIVLNAPHHAVVSKVDETQAARKVDVGCHHC